ALDRYKPAAFLLDSPARWSEGQARAPISLTLAREAAARGRVILSAGLRPETVGEAIRIARPWGVDVNSGVEAGPGRQDPARGPGVRPGGAGGRARSRRGGGRGAWVSARVFPIGRGTSGRTGVATSPRRS